MAEPLVTRRGHAGGADLPAGRDARRGARGEQRRPATHRHRGGRRQRVPPPAAPGRAGGPGGRRHPSVHGLGRPDPQRLRRLPDLEPHPPGPEPRRHPRQRGDLPRAVDRREVEPHAGAGGRPPAPARVGHRGLPGRLHRCRRPRGRAGAQRSSGRCAGRAAAGTSSTAWSPSAATPIRRASSPSSRAVASSGCDASARRRWSRSASTATASAAGRSTPTAACWPTRCAGSPSRFRLSAPKHALGVGRPDHVVSAFALGYSIFDCALPTRDARHGRLYAFRDGWAGRRPSPATPSIAPCASTTRSTASTTGRSRTAATARSARATPRPTCITCSRSATCRPSGSATLHNLRFYVRLFALLRG